MLDNTKFDVIHFNNGMHGWQHSEDEYAKAFPAFVAAIKQHAPKAKLIFATTTTLKDSKLLPPGNQTVASDERIAKRNEIARAAFSRNKTFRWMISMLCAAGIPSITGMMSTSTNRVSPRRARKSPPRSKNYSGHEPPMGNRFKRGNRFSPSPSRSCLATSPRAMATGRGRFVSTIPESRDVPTRVSCRLRNRCRCIRNGQKDNSRH